MNPFNNIIEDINTKNLDQPKYANIKELLETDIANAVLRYFKSAFDLTNSFDEIQLPIMKEGEKKYYIYQLQIK